MSFACFRKERFSPTASLLLLLFSPQSTQHLADRKRSHSLAQVFTTNVVACTQDSPLH